MRDGTVVAKHTSCSYFSQTMAQNGTWSKPEILKPLSDRVLVDKDAHLRDVTLRKAASLRGLSIEQVRENRESGDVGGLSGGFGHNALERGKSDSQIPGHTLVLRPLTWESENQVAERSGGLLVYEGVLQLGDKVFQIVCDARKPMAVVLSANTRRVTDGLELVSR